MGRILKMKKIANSRKLDVYGSSVTDEVIAQLAHDFNNLLTPLLAYPSLIKMELSESSNAYSLLDVLDSTAKDMLHMTQQLLEFSSKNTAEKEAIDIVATVRGCVDQINADADPKECNVIFSSGVERAIVKAVTEDVTQSVAILCGNAKESLLESSDVRVSVDTVSSDGSNGSPSGDYVMISVADSGSGVASEITDTLFDPLVTTKKGMKKRGAGLGLSIVYRIMMRHDGFVSYDTELGKGSEFCLYFPVADTEDVEGEEPQPMNTSKDMNEPSETPNSEPKVGKILVVDDEECITNLFKMILGLALPSCTIDLASNGQEAIELFKEHQHDVLLMDLHMPVMDGQAAFMEIEKLCKQDCYNMPAVVFCTGFAPPDSLMSSIATSSRHCFLSKPVDGDTLVNAVASKL